MQQIRQGKIRKKAVLLLFSAVLYAGAVVPAQAVEIAQVTPVGRAVGIRMTSDGVMVVNIIGVQTTRGVTYPAKSAGLRTGDIIQKANGTAIDSNQTLQEVVERSRKGTVVLDVMRSGTSMELKIQPEADATGVERIGVMVRDSIAGIGTVTFIDPKTGEFASLGHAICDAETGTLLPLATGSVTDANITGVIKGISGEPGELQGNFNLQKDLGTLKRNTVSGLFGKMSDAAYYQKLRSVALVSTDEAKVGPAQILSNVDGKSSRLFSINVTKIYNDDDAAGRGMMIEVTDPVLLKQTGGIVQGMSGSPVLQNGKLIGAVTHVLVNDPRRGYAIFAQKMYDEMKKG